MLKYIVTITLALTMLACGSDQETETEATNQQESQSQSQQQQQFQPNQNAVDIEVSEEELEKFAEVSMAAQEVQMESQREMIAVLEEEGLDVETYNMIAEARFGDQDESSLDVSSDDIEKFDAASERIDGMQSNIESEMSEMIEAEGMEMERFMEINMAMQQDQELQQRMQQMMMQNMQQGQGQGQDMQQPQDQ